MGVLSKDIKLSYNTSAESTYTDLTNLQEIPDVGNNSADKIDVTVLTDNVKKSMAGLRDSAQDLAFKFLYEKEQFETVAAMDDTISWKITLPDSLAATFTGTPSVKLDSVGTNAALTYTLTVTVESEVEFA